MKKSLSAYLRYLIVSVAFLLFSHGAYANHIIGMEMEYAWQSGSTYQINLIVYGDCGDVTGAFPLLATSAPNVAVFNGGTYVTCLTLSIDSPSTGILTSPVCPADTALTTCTSLSYTIPGIKKFVYTTTYTFSGTSHYWRFVFLGTMGTTSFAGRQATITNIVAPGTSVICLIDTLDNTYHNNVSTAFGNTPTPFYCLNVPTNYNPAATNADGDSLVYYLVPGEVGNYPVMICNTIPGTFVTYTGTAWGTTIIQPITDTTPLEVDSGSFSFSHSNGDMAFDPNFTQRALVVYNIDEYHNDTFIGNSQHELVFVVETCTASPPSASITGATGAGLATDSVNYTICEGTGAFSFHLNPIGGTGLDITVTPVDIPTGASFTITGDSTTSPTCTFSWTSTGVPLGTYTFYVSYQDNNCPINGLQTVAYTITVTAPPTIAATTPACVGLTTTLDPTPAGGIWTSGSTTVATVGSSSGIVTGASPGTSVITYSLGSGCTVTTVVTANPVPAAISGATIVCPGSAITLGDTSPGGTWSSSSIATATVSGSVVVTGASPGTTTITYTAGGCTAVKVVTVTALPPAIGGIFTVCQYLTTALSDAGGGTWTSSNTGVATIGPTGIVTGTGPGVSTITYSIGTGCSVSAIVTVNAAPLPISGTLSVCGGFTTTLSDATTGGTWSIFPSSAYATVVATTGVVTTGIPLIPTAVVITYTAPGGCSITTTVTINPAPSSIGGPPGVMCAGQSVTFIESGSGIWSSSSPLIATVGSTTGTVTGVGASGGTATITYTLSTGCSATTVVTVNSLPSPITPSNPVICIGSTVTLSDVTAGGYWISNNTGIATVDPIFGVVTGAIGGVDTLLYTVSSSGCSALVSLTVNPAPPGIGGAGTVCPGASVTLTDLAGGTWSSSNTAVASIGLTTGIAWGGPAAGSGSATTITYTAPGGCSITTTLMLSSLPSAFAATHVCVGQSATLSDPTTPGGAWSISGSDATIASGDVLIGISAGTATVTYSEGGCYITGVVTVNPAPGPIGGTRTVCAGSTTTLTDGGTGTWASGTASSATIGSATGVVSGILAGTSLITYSAGGTCVATAIVTVDALPVAAMVSTGGSYCAGGTGVLITLGGSTAGIKYYLYLGGVAIDSVTGTGASLSFGLQTAMGTYTVIAVNPSTGCSRAMTGSATVTVIPLPAVYIVSGGGAYCSGSGGTALPIVLSGSDIGVTYKLYNGALLLTSMSGTGSALSFGTYPGAGTYTVIASSGGCTATMTGSAVITIEPLLSLFTVTGTTPICPGVAGAPVGLNGSTIGVNYQLYNGTSTVGPPVAGTGLALNFGLLPAGVYTVVATNPVTTCTRTMTGSATITVSPVPVISGATAVCIGASIVETVPGFSGGTWISSNTSVATVVTATGTAWGVDTGTTVITYTSTSGCTGTTVVTVSPSPGPITGSNSVCVGATAAETDAPLGGLWTSTPTATATIGSLSGIVTGGRMGTATITYSLGSGCTVTRVMTVTAAPDGITGSLNICTGACTTLGDLSTGGTWSVSPLTVATVSGTGSVCGVAAGTAAVTYTLGGCTATTTVTANIAPGPITGPSGVCAGSTITLADGTGGTWTSSATLIGTVDDDGNVLGEIGGITTITYSLGGTCVATHAVTVDPVSPIMGSLGLCVATTTILADAAAGGIWVSSNTAVATVTSSGGGVSGVSPGTSEITYTTTAGCMATVIVTVNLAPATITGTMQMCIGLCTILYDAASGGTWTSGNTAIATVNSTSGQVCGTAAGTSEITYSLGFGCTRTAVVTVNSSPAPVRGIFVVCEGVSSTLTDATTGGTWSSSNTAVASVTFGGTLIGGTTPGTATITYSPSTGCPAITTVTVNAPPTAILGTVNVCVGSTTALSDATTGGTWGSSNMAVATVTEATGIVHSIAPGITTITYTAGSCSVTALVTVVPPPPAITGGPMVCEGQSTLLSDASAGGTWSTGPSSLATIDAIGNLWGVSSGTVLVSYTTGTGCTAVSSVIVNALSPVTGDSIVCAGLSVTLTDTTAGGAWSSSSPSVATAIVSGLTTGLVTGASPGAATITYTLPTGCSSTRTVTVNPAPPAILGPRSVCYESTVTLGDAVSGGTWSSSNTAIATVDITTGVVEGVTASGAPATISYTLSGTGCPAEAEVTVYPVPPAITGESIVCIRSTLYLTDALSGGVWGSTDTMVAVIDSAGMVTGVRVGTTTISYIFGSCSASIVVTVSGAPMAIIGPSSVCQGDAIALTDPTGGGSWSSSSTTVATVGSSSGIVSGANAGTSVITYTTGTGGCNAVRLITVNLEPGGFSETLCQGVGAPFTDVPAGGTWSSDNTAVLLIDTLTGAASTPSSGTATVTYTSPAGCSVTETVIVNPSPAPITGALAICLGFSTTLNDATSGGGPWASSNTAVATVDVSGDVYGLLPGTATISYPSGSGICSATVVVTVNPAPGFIEGPGTVCSGSSVTLGDSPGGGTWSSSDATIAAIGSYSGVVTGTSTAPVPETAYITYSLGIGCTTYTIVTVNPVPAAITGTNQVCLGVSGALTDVTGGGLWSSSNPLVAAITSPSAGVYTTGAASGTATISYTFPGTGCAAIQTVTVNPEPESITGNTQICLGSSQTLGDIPAGGTWSSSNTLVASVAVPAVGVVTGVSLGAATITYTLAGCPRTTTVVVNPLPAVFTITGGGNYCAGGAGVPIGLSGSGSGVNYLLYHGSTATGTVSGTGGDLSFGLQRVAGSYTVIGVSTSTGCSNVMAGSATITIMPTVTPLVSVTTGVGVGDTVCAGTSTTFTPIPVNGGLTPAYQWSVNGVPVSTAGAYTYVPANGDEVTVILTSDAMCPSPVTATGTVRMTVWSQELPVAGVSVSPGDTVCQGSSVALSAMPLYGGLSPSYTWMKNGTASGAGPVYRYEPVNGDMLYLSMASDYPCRTEGTVTSNVITMTVDTPELPLVTINASPGTSAGIGLFDTLTASVTNGGTNPQYQWVVNDLPVAGATSNTFISNNYSYPNEDSVTCLVTSSGECSATSFGWVYISEHPAGVTTQSTGGGFTVLPNPNSGSFTVKGGLGTGTDEEVTIEITDMLGQAVYTEKIMAQNGKVNERIILGQTIANGMYLLNVRTGEGNNVFHIVVEQ